MPEPKVRFKRDDGSSYPAWKDYSISDLFTKIGNKNKDGQNTNVITNSAEFGLIPQRDYFDKDIAVEGNTGNYTIIQTGDFVYNPRKSTYAPMGPFNCYRLPEDGIVSPLYSCLRPKGILNPEYLLWYFQTNKWYGYVNDHGAQNGARHDRVGMTDKILMGIPVTAPCEEEQQKIADFLSSVDEVIAASEEEVGNLETQKKAAMKKIFSQEVRFKRDDGTEFPAWEEKSFDELADYKKGPFGSALKKEIFVPKGRETVKVYEQQNAIGKDWRLERYFITAEYANKMKSFEVHSGDIIVSCAGTIGEIYEVPVGAEPGIINQALMRVRVNERTINKYIFACVFDAMISNEGKRISNGSALKNIPPFADMKKQTALIPGLEEQRLIADFLSDFDEAIAAAKKELELWKELKKGLLQQMFV